MSQIIRGQRPQNNFYILDKGISEDSKLSWEARGVLIFLLGKPDDWKVSVAHLVKMGSAGRDKMYKIINELIEAGYCKRLRGSGGRGVDYQISEIPLPEKPETEIPLPENPLPENPFTENPTLLSTEYKQELSSTKNTCEVREIFDHWKFRMNHPQAKFTGDRKTTIKARLDDGYTPEQLKQAIDGCASSAWHMGVHPDNSKRFDQIGLIFRNGSKVEQFIDLLEDSQRGHHAANDANGAKPSAKKFGSADIQNFDIYQEFGIPRDGDDLRAGGVHSSGSDVSNVVYEVVRDKGSVLEFGEGMGECDLRGAANDESDQVSTEFVEAPQNAEWPAESVSAEPNRISGVVPAESTVGSAGFANTGTRLQSDLQCASTVAGSPSPDSVLGSQRDGHVGDAEFDAEQNSKFVHPQLRDRASSSG